MRGAAFQPMTASRHTSWHAAFHATTAGSLVRFHRDGIDEAIELFLLGHEIVIVSQLVIAEPIQSVLHGLLDFVLIVALKLYLQFLFLQSVNVWRAATSMNNSLPLTS